MHAAYDCPMKHSSRRVLKIGRQLSKARGATKGNGRITWKSAFVLATGHFPQYVGFSKTS